MTEDDFLKKIKTMNVNISKSKGEQHINLTNNLLKQINLPLLNDTMINFYKKYGNLILGGSIILDIDNNNKNSIFGINKNLMNISKLKNKTIYALNDLFWFAYSNDNYYMIDNIYLNTVIEYKDFYKSLIDCLKVGES